MSATEDPWDFYAPEDGKHAGLVCVDIDTATWLTPDDARVMAADLLERAAFAEGIGREPDGLRYDHAGDRWVCGECSWTAAPELYFGEAEADHDFAQPGCIATLSRETAT